MKERLLDLILCPSCGAEFNLTIHERNGSEVMEGALTCMGGHKYPVTKAIPRLVQSDYYVENFSFEWNKFARVQLDIYNGTMESEETLILKTGFTKNEVSGKLILDAGIGSGRFSDVISRWGGEVIGIDLSYAVDAAYNNIGSRPNVHIIQADIFNLPFKRNIFDYIFSIGVLHHTPDTAQAFDKLLPHLMPGGEIAIWVYAAYYEGVQHISSLLRKLTTKTPKRLVYWLSSIVIPLYYIWPLRKIMFPLLQFSTHKNPKWRWLDTFDWYTPHYAWKHTYPEVFNWFKKAGLNNVTLLEVPVSMRGRK